jgi:hypothetical protein
MFNLVWSASGDWQAEPRDKSLRGFDRFFQRQLYQ